jgi:hypothetical protein
MPGGGGDIFVHICKQVLGEQISTSALKSLLSYNCRGLYIGKYPPPPPGEGEISADVIWGKKYEKWKRKRGKM